MSFRYVNFYAHGLCGVVEFLTPQEAQFVALQWDDHKLVQQRLLAHWHRPPVGMSAEKASHAWFIGPDGKAECLYNKVTKQIALETAR